MAAVHVHRLTNRSSHRPTFCGGRVGDLGRLGFWIVVRKRVGLRSVLECFSSGGIFVMGVLHGLMRIGVIPSIAASILCSFT